MTARATTQQKEDQVTAVAKIYPALANVMEGMANIPKNGKMDFKQTQYAYLRADDVQERLNPLLVANKIIVRSEVTVRDVVKGQRDWVYVDLILTYVSSEDGSEFVGSIATGESIAGDDKSVNKALTQAIKNAHRAQFQFTSGEDEPDNHGGAPDGKTTPEPAALTAAKRIGSRAPQAPKANAPATNTLPTKTLVMAEYLTPGTVRKEDAGVLLHSAQLAGLTGDAQYQYVAELCPVVIEHPDKMKRIDEIAKQDYMRTKKIEGLAQSVRDAFTFEVG